MVQNSRYLKIGPGGRRCNCCFPAPRSKDRRAQFRIAKRKAEREAMRNAEADMVDHWAMLREELDAEYKQAYGDDYWSFNDDQDWIDDWIAEDDPVEADHHDERDLYCDDYYNLEDDYISIQSEQEKVARALGEIMGEHWQQQLTNAKRFMEAMKRNAQ